MLISFIEVNLGILCNCLLLLPPFLRQHLPWLLGGGPDKKIAEEQKAPPVYYGGEPSDFDSEQAIAPGIYGGATKDSKQEMVLGIYGSARKA